MDEKKQPLPELPKPPEQPEVPEEGFVPYCAEVQETGSKHDRKTVFLFVLLLLVIAGIVVIMIGRSHNFYHTVLDKLMFDYREGEQTGQPDEVPDGSDAIALAEQSKNKEVKLFAYLYEFDEDRKQGQTITRYSYNYSAVEEFSAVKIGTSRWFGTGEKHYRKKYNQPYEAAKGSKWEATDTAYFPPIYAYCFGVNPSNGVTYSLYQSYQTTVKGEKYDCEIWLMCDQNGAEPLYLTLYRYYQGGRLAGVRVLNNVDSQMQIYDVQSYSFA